jgi:hypothetical protein
MINIAFWNIESLGLGFRECDNAPTLAHIAISSISGGIPIQIGTHS